MQTTVILSVKNQPHLIPYPPATGENSGHPGFVPLKGKPEAVEAIPAVHESEALKQALVKINGSNTPFITVACKQVLNNHAGRFWTRGYLEFALNYVELAKDSPNYFLLFEQFTKYVIDSKFNIPVDFNFELHAATFSKAAAEGHTACVWITTAEFPNEDGALKTWNQSIGFLAEFLGCYEKLDLPAIYEG